MTTVQVDLDEETFDGLLDSALSERRPIPWHAAVLLRRALNLPFPVSPAIGGRTRELPPQPAYVAVDGAAVRR